MRSVRVLWFAWLRDRLGRAEETVELPDDVADVGGLLAWLRKREPVLAAIAGEGRVIRAAINQEFVGLDAAVGAGDEVAFFPPVTGG